jgi:hypothetical protein
MVDLLIKLGLGRGNSSIGGSIAIKNDQKRGKLGFFVILPTRSLPIFDQNWYLEWCEWQKTLSKGHSRNVAAITGRRSSTYSLRGDH